MLLKIVSLLRWMRARDVAAEESLGLRDSER